eukprot:scaffold91135_cov36-Phaeocystis_antarctica.AAC.1
MGKRPATGGATGDGACCLCRGCGLKVHTSRKYLCHQIDRGQSSNCSEKNGVGRRGSGWPPARRHGI